MTKYDIYIYIYIYIYLYICIYIYIYIYINLYCILSNSVILFIESMLQLKDITISPKAPVKPLSFDSINHYYQTGTMTRMRI